MKQYHMVEVKIYSSARKHSQTRRRTDNETWRAASETRARGKLRREAVDQTSFEIQVSKNRRLK